MSSVRRVPATRDASEDGVLFNPHPRGELSLPMRSATILVCTDFSAAADGAVKEAIRLCRLVDARLLVAHVFEYGSIAESIEGASRGPDRLPDEKTACSHMRRLNALVLEVKAHGVDAEAILLEGVAADVILTALVEHRVDMAVLGTHGLGGWERMVFGSTAETVLRNARCPVITIGPRAAMKRKEEGASRGPVVFATDFHSLTQEAVRNAIELARLQGVALHCLHVLPLSMEGAAETPVVWQIMTQALRHLVEEIEGEEAGCEYAIVYGSDVSHAIVNYAASHDAELIVLGVRRASLIASRLPPQLTYRVLMTALCPVLTVSYEQGASWGGRREALA